MNSYCSAETTQLALALIDVQRDMSPATKDANNPFTKSNYATLNSVMDACRDALLRHGIWLTQLPVPAPVELGAGYIGLLTKLTHAESGQWQSSLTVAPLPKNDPQGMGSALTYCRRYALTSMLGMVTEDDDGNAARQETEDARTKNGNTPSPQKKAASKSIPSLPLIDGVTYKRVKGEDGLPYVIASGRTLEKKNMLVAAGFKWNPQQRIWWRSSDTA